MRSLTGGVCIKLLTKLCHNQRSPLARLHIRYHKPIGIRCTASVLGTMREDTLRDERFEVRVSFDERRGYVAHANGLPTITALSLAVARRRINERLIGEDLDVKLVLDRAARLGRRKNQARAAVKRAAEEEWGHAHVGLLFKLATPPRARCAASPSTHGARSASTAGRARYLMQAPRCIVCGARHWKRGLAN
jgi:hypothetical protein